MPLYVYKCNNCENQFEVRQRFSDDPLTVCPECEGDIRRVINPVGIVFKGSGFYVTDSRNGKKSAMINGSSSSNSEEKSEKGEKGETADKSAKKSEDSSASTSVASKSDSTSTPKSSEAAA
jgi:putative FmdB family regulatory protein